ncbi:GAF domain-containing sensor histidine kinase [Massilia sp.]|uniref:GAF domain-containing sensor histidine kinase n=1 Tax=Massilia sp. TaxID=1882437 RepID=UPI0028A2BC6B|nr:GAF domain-containing sensor histidine kinase [Massilia sp.]
MVDNVLQHVSEIQAISVVPRVLETVAALTGVRFACVAHVTATSWTACAVHDLIDFGVKPGDQLEIGSTVCQEVHATRQPVVIDDVRDCPPRFRNYIPLLNGYKSYFSIPIFRRDGLYFGTLCGTDPEPLPLSHGPTLATLTLFAELISNQLDSERSLREARSDLLSERETAELREQFIAVLGHDLRTPLNAILNRVELLRRRHEEANTVHALDRIRASALRIEGLVDNVVDFTRGRMGDGLALDLRKHTDVDQILEQVVEELRAANPDRTIIADIAPRLKLRCDAQRLAQLLSNLLKNALVHGDKLHPAVVTARIDTDECFVLEVSNGGPDLSPAVMSHLFKPYWRAISRTGNDGLGLGLYIVDQIVRAHGGTICVSSRDGTTTFTFVMPAA